MWCRQGWLTVLGFQVSKGEVLKEGIPFNERVIPHDIETPPWYCPGTTLSITLKQGIVFGRRRKVVEWEVEKSAPLRELLSKARAVAAPLFSRW